MRVGSRYRGARVVVLGAAGFIGHWVSRQLSDAGARLSLIVRDRTKAAALFSSAEVEGEVIETNLLDFAALVKLLTDLRPSIVFNLCGYGVDPGERDERTAFQINAELVRVVCEAMATHRDPDWRGQAVIHAGSALEYGESCGDLDEASVPHPTTLYGKSKLAGTLALDRACRQGLLKSLTARLFTVYGPGEHAGRLLPMLIEAARLGTDIPLTAGRQQRDFTFVGDVAEGILRLGICETMGETIVNLATGRLTTVREFVEVAAKIMHIQHDRLKWGALPTRSEEMHHLPLKLRRIRKLIDWIPSTTIEEGLRLTSLKANVH